MRCTNTIKSYFFPSCFKDGLQVSGGSHGKQFLKNRYVALESFLLFNLKFSDYLDVSRCIGPKDHSTQQRTTYSQWAESEQRFLFFH